MYIWTRSSLSMRGAGSMDHLVFGLFGRRISNSAQSVRFAVRRAGVSDACDIFPADPTRPLSTRLLYDSPGRTLLCPYARPTSLRNRDRRPESRAYLPHPISTPEPSYCGPSTLPAALHVNPSFDNQRRVTNVVLYITFMNGVEAME
jgi:hypothetical protein